MVLASLNVLGVLGNSAVCLNRIRCFDSGVEVTCKCKKLVQMR